MEFVKNNIIPAKNKIIIYIIKLLISVLLKAKQVYKEIVVIKKKEKKIGKI